MKGLSDKGQVSHPIGERLQAIKTRIDALEEIIAERARTKLVRKKTR